MQLEELLARWDTGDGKPFKGKLIDWDRYGGDGNEPPADAGCMCAQGQALHFLGGWEPSRLHNIDQAEADLATAELLNISISHAIVLRSVNDSVDGAPSIVLTNPEKVLGAQAPRILAFWLHLDRMTDADWRAAWDAWAARAAWDAWAARAAWDARDARAAWDAWAARAAWDARAARDARDAIYAAVAEVAGATWLAEHEEGKFVFLPMFGFANPEAIPALPEDYGKPA